MDDNPQIAINDRRGVRDGHGDNGLAAATERHFLLKNWRRESVSEERHLRYAAVALGIPFAITLMKAIDGGLGTAGLYLIMTVGAAIGGAYFGFYLQKEQRESDSRRVAAQAELINLMAELGDDEGDPVSREVVRLHSPATHRGGLCVACSATGTPVTWPCSTVRLVAKHHGIDVPADI